MVIKRLDGKDTYVLKEIEEDGLGAELVISIDKLKKYNRKPEWLKDIRA